jgi:hypothetical protein
MIKTFMMPDGYDLCAAMAARKTCTTKCFMSLRSPTDNEKGGKISRSARNDTRKACCHLERGERSFFDAFFEGAHEVRKDFVDFFNFFVNFVSAVVSYSFDSVAALPRCILRGESFSSLRAFFHLRNVK